MAEQESVLEKVRHIIGEEAYARISAEMEAQAARRALPRPRRLKVSRRDPVRAAVAAAAAEGPLVRQVDDEDPTLVDLPGFIEVEEDDRDGRLGTVVWLEDEVQLYADPYDSGLEQALAEQPGIDEVRVEEREEILVRTRLALKDVHAAVIRAVVEVNRRPRPARMPADG